MNDRQILILALTLVIPLPLFLLNILPGGDPLIGISSFILSVLGISFAVGVFP